VLGNAGSGNVCSPLPENTVGAFTTTCWNEATGVGSAVIEGVGVSLPGPSDGSADADADRDGEEVRDRDADTEGAAVEELDGATDAAGEDVGEAAIELEGLATGDGDTLGAGLGSATLQSSPATCDALSSELNTSILWIVPW
jgi:hypothetical protein